MPGHDSLPPWTKVEGYLARFPPLDLAIGKVHAQRKKYYLWRQRVRDRRCPRGLRNFERKVSSQHGEDGIIAEIFARIGEGGKYASSSASRTAPECCTRHLFEARGWAGLLIDGSPDAAAAARRLYAGKPVGVLARFLRVEDILPTFAEAGVPVEPDLLVIDVDGNDYWLWEKLLEVYRPRVVVIEYNARWVPPRRWIMPYDPAHRWDSSVCFGPPWNPWSRSGRGTAINWWRAAPPASTPSSCGPTSSAISSPMPAGEAPTTTRPPSMGEASDTPSSLRGTGDRRQETETGDGGRLSRLGY
jgi:hypothetical protein